MCSPPPPGKEIKFDGLTLSTCHSIINLMDVSLPADVCACACTWIAVDSVFAMLVWCFSVALDDEPGGQHRDAGVSGVQGLLGEDEEVDRTFPFLVVTNLKHATIITKTSGK